MKDYEFSTDAVANLDEQAQRAGADKDEDQHDADPVEQTLDVPMERPADEAAKFVQKQYKEKSGLDLDADSAREIVETARAGSESSDPEAASESESDSESDSDTEDAEDSDAEADKS
ncbi:MAG: hypothetical protein LLG14_08115 [Nocardiaceae bacterium]|nr:hypothetical protein [Nocardiaceae bacterium]